MHAKDYYCYLIYSIIFTLPWTSLTRAQSCPDVLRTICSDANQVRIYLVDELSSVSPPLSVTCGSLGATLEGWSMSSNGASTSTLLDTSSAGYSRNGNTLTLTSLDGSSEGLYQCVYTTGRTCELCIYVFGRAVFASCPQEINGCSESTVSLSAIAGGSVPFNATVVHTAGGSCGFLQDIRNVRLIKTDDRFGFPDQTLLSCSISPDSTTPCSNGRVSLDRGRDPGYEFIFTLSDVNASDAGTYEVVMEVRHPATLSSTELSKTFSLEVSMAPTEAVSFTTTNAPVSLKPSTRMTTFTELTTRTTTEFSVVDIDRNRQGDSSTITTVVVVVIISVAMLVLLSVLVLMAVVYLKRRQDSKRDDESERSPIQEQHRVVTDYSAPSVSQEQGHRHINYSAATRNGNVAQMAIRHDYPLTAVRRDMLCVRDSCIEPDTNLPDLLRDTHDHLNSEHKLVTICESEDNQECNV